jgi:translation initiation factor IF-3
LVGANGEQLGIMTVNKGMDLANDLGLDLVEISPNTNPPVCKILDYGRYKYEMQKKQSVARKSQKLVEIKEIKVRPNIDEPSHDHENVKLF